MDNPPEATTSLSSIDLSASQTQLSPTPILLRFPHRTLPELQSCLSQYLLAYALKIPRASSIQFGDTTALCPLSSSARYKRGPCHEVSPRFQHEWLPEYRTEPLLILNISMYWVLDWHVNTAFVPGFNVRRADIFFRVAPSPTEKLEKPRHIA